MVLLVVLVERQTGYETCDEAGRFQLDTFSELVVVVVVVVLDALPLLAVGVVVLAVSVPAAVASETPSLGLVAMSQYLLPMIGV